MTSIWSVALASTLLCMAPLSLSGQESFPTLSDPELIAELEKEGLMLLGTGVEPGKRFSNPPPKRDAYLSVYKEIGKRIVLFMPWPSESPPVSKLLIEFIEKEAPLNRIASERGDTLSMTEDALELLSLTQDPAGVPICLKILEGWESKVSVDERRAARDALENLTHITFTSFTGARIAIPSKNGLIAANEDFDALEKRYREWLASEGKNSMEWKGIAAKRSREILQSGEKADYDKALTFLDASMPLDSDPEASLRILVKLALESDTKEFNFTFWLPHIAKHGPRARPYAPELIKRQSQEGLNDSKGFEALGKIGGADVLSYFLTELPHMTDVNSSARTVVRDAFDHQAGRTFANDAERKEWWSKNRMRAPQQWLNENLPYLANQADHGDRRADRILSRLVEDIPVPNLQSGEGIRHLRRELTNFTAISAIREELGNGPFYSRWIGSHRGDLIYDAVSGTFRLSTVVR